MDLSFIGKILKGGAQLGIDYIKNLNEEQKYYKEKYSYYSEDRLFDLLLSQRLSVTQKSAVISLLKSNYSYSDDEIKIELEIRRL